MAELFNQKSVPATVLPGGARLQRLFDEQRIEASQCRFDLLTLDAGASLQIEVPRSEVAWVQLLTGSAVLESGEKQAVLGELHVFFLPPGFVGKLTSSDAAQLIRLEISDAVQLDPGLLSIGSEAQFFDLGAEPVLQSQHDERTRIYVATKKLFATTALAGELVIFPAGACSANHHHVGAEHFQYILRGTGTVFINETPQRIEPGDLVYKYDGERHYCQNDEEEELAFVEFFIPGEWETVWVDPDRSCTWSPTGQNIRGGAASREIGAHTSDGTLYEDV
ncbi:MAG: cupin domain-containing protein [Gammaproteobacteria bacterium]|nr:cupin domain-containing protein [Gammaproteobacteria bacterium]